MDRHGLKRGGVNRFAAEMQAAFFNGDEPGELQRAVEAGDSAPDNSDIDLVARQPDQQKGAQADIFKALALSAPRRSHRSSALSLGGCSR